MEQSARKAPGKGANRSIVTANFHGVRPVGQPVEKRRSQGRISKQLPPAGKAGIRRYNHRSPLVSFCQEPEEKLRSLPGERHVSKLIEDKEAEP